ncbi:hypothetical protein CC2G_012711 [Coprinopsis cinerea AmutBmut pab1-1]|nr:hypothetical protein CC2G_012711 [Coprinopsis cinerea AmutBmut pab1-1]
MSLLFGTKDSTPQAFVLVLFIAQQLGTAGPGFVFAPMTGCKAIDAESVLPSHSQSLKVRVSMQLLYYGLRFCFVTYPSIVLADKEHDSFEMVRMFPIMFSLELSLVPPMVRWIGLASCWQCWQQSALCMPPTVGFLTSRPRLIAPQDMITATFSIIHQGCQPRIDTARPNAPHLGYHLRPDLHPSRQLDPDDCDDRPRRRIQELESTNESVWICKVRQGV